MQGAGLREAGPPRGVEGPAGRVLWRSKAFLGGPGSGEAGVRAEGTELAEGRVGVARGREAAVFFFEESPALAIRVGCGEMFSRPGGLLWGHRLGCLLNRCLLSPSRLTGEMKGTLLARCVAPPRSVVYFCQNGLPALGSSTKMNPFTSFGKVSLLDILGSNHAFLVTSAHFRWLVCLLESGKLGPVCLFHAFTLL